MIEEDVTGDLHLVVAHTEEHVTLINGRVFIDGVAVLQRHLSAAVIFPELQIHDTCNRVGAVGGGRAVLQNFDALNSRQWNSKQVLKGSDAALAYWVGSNPPAIN